MPTHEHSKHSWRIACTNVVPGCGFTASAGSEEDLVAQVVAHAKDTHGITEITPELAEKVKAAVVRQ